MGRYVAFLRAVNVGKRTVAMARARGVLERLGYADVASFVNSGNLIFSSDATAAACEKVIRAALEDEFGFEVTTFVRTAAQVRTLAADKPFGTIATGHTHFVLLLLTTPTAREKAAILALGNDHDEVVVKGGDVHWLIQAKSTDTTLGPKEWKRALPDNTTTARNTTMLAKLVDKL